MTEKGLNKQENAKLRRYEIMAKVKERGRLSVDEIRRLWDVADQTIRTDLRAIEGLPKMVRESRTHGLTVKPDEIFEKTYFQRSHDKDWERKRRIAKALLAATEPSGGAPLIDRDRGSVVVGSGSTCLAALERLSPYPLQIMTTNVGVLTMPHVMTQSLHLSGGRIERESASLVGMASVRGIENFRAETALLGVSGLDLDERSREVHLFCHHEVQSPTNQALIANRKSVIVLTCGEKLGRRDPWRFAEVSRILADSDFYVVTDEAPEMNLAPLREWLAAASAQKGRQAGVIVANQGRDGK